MFSPVIRIKTSFIPNSPKLDTTLIPMKTWMDKQIAVYLYHVILHNNVKRQAYCYSKHHERNSKTFNFYVSNGGMSLLQSLSLKEYI